MSGRPNSVIGFLSAWQLAVLAGGLLTLARIIILIQANYELAPDEAQYWDWSRNFAFGYFSKPPMIAWLIGLTTGICGDAEACIRVSSPLLHFATSLLIFALARDLYDAKVGVLAAFVFITLPGVSFSSGLASTDVPLLFFWCGALFAFNRFLETGKTSWGAAFGIALGLGILSKYAMAYFLLCAMVYFLLAPQQRKKLSAKGSLVAGGVALLLCAPNIIWNMRNGFVTFGHTAANAGLDAELFNPGSVVDFLVDQVGLFGPILFFCLLWGALSLFRLRKAGGQVDRRSLFLLSFSFPILIFVLVLSFISRANANWAATAYIAACIFVTAWLTQGRRIRALYASFALHLALVIGLSALVLAPVLIERVGLDNAFKRVRGWNLMASEVLDLAQLEPKAQSILADDRSILTELLYYGRDTDLPLFIWDYNGRPQNHYELTVTLPKDAKDPILLVARNDDPQAILRAFKSHEFVKLVTVPTGGNRTRRVFVYRLEGYDGD